MLAGILIVLVAPGSAGGTDPATASRSLPLTTVTVAVLPVEAAALPLYAKHRGFFERQGIDARIVVLSEPTQIAAAVLSGDAEFSGFTTGGLALLRSRGAPVRLVAAGALHRPNAPATGLVAAPGKRISRPRDLIGKRIAIDAPNTLGHVGLLKWLKRNGLSADDVQLSEIPFAQMLGPLMRGTVDAAILPEPFLTLAIRRGARPIADTLSAVCSRECLVTISMARRDVDPNLAARFRNAIQAAAVWANNRKNDRASGAILAGYAPIDEAVIRNMRRASFATRLRPALAQPWIDVFAEFGLIPASFSANDLVK